LSKGGETVILLMPKMPFIQYLPPPQPIRKSMWVKIVSGVCTLIIVAAGMAYLINLFGDDDRDGLSNCEEMYIYHTNPHSLDTDGDWIADGVETKDNVKINLEVYKCTHTDPLKIDTDGGGLDDFNEVYTYGMNPNDPADDRAFVEKIPNVKVNDVKPWEGGTGGPWPPAEKYIEVSIRDPLVQWYANRTEIKWVKEKDKIVGKIMIPFVSQDNEYSVGFFPAYTLTHGNKGLCAPQAFLNAAILNLKGYKPVVVYGTIYEEGKYLGHAWVEVQIDRKDYVVSWDTLYSKDEYYKNWVASKQ